LEFLVVMIMVRAHVFLAESILVLGACAQLVEWLVVASSANS
jgi:hypothetical protein